MERIKKPFSIQIEFVEGCNKMCGFCGMRAIRKEAGENLIFMEDKTLINTIRSIASWIPKIRIELAMHGEPTLHPKYLEYISTLRRYLPKAQIMITTNAVSWLGSIEQEAHKVLKAGCNFIVMDTYRPEREEIRAELETIHSIDIEHYYETKISPYQNHGQKIQNTIIVMDDISMHNGEDKRREILNHAGNNLVRPEIFAKQSTCTNVWREISVTAEGNVNICCMDFGSEYICGNVNDKTLKEIWTGDEFMSARRLLQNKERVFTPCIRCNKGAGGRVGLLSKVKMPSEADYSTVKKVVMRNTGKNSFKPIFNRKIREEMEKNPSIKKDIHGGKQRAKIKPKKKQKK
jgi:radical SAM protein with 4Fe4S-binding SPASM domain